MELCILMRVSEKESKLDVCQHFHLHLQAPEIGEEEADTQLPFSQTDLNILLRTLDVNRSTHRDFLPSEWARLQEWNLINGECRNSEDHMTLTENALEFKTLCTFLQQKLRDTLFPTEAFRSALRSILDRVPKNDVLHIRLEIPAGEKGQHLQLFHYPWELLSQDNVLWQNKRVNFSR